MEFHTLALGLLNSERPPEILPTLPLPGESQLPSCTQRGTNVALRRLDSIENTHTHTHTQITWVWGIYNPGIIKCSATAPL